MLWEQIQRFKEFGSLLFCIAFSISSLVWNSNIFLQTLSKTGRISEFFSSTLDGFGSSFKRLVMAIKTNESLRREKEAYEKLIEEYKSLPHDLETLRKENSSLRRELGFSVHSKYPTLKAEVLSVRLNSIYRTIIISKGRKDGILPYMPVVARAFTKTREVVPAIVGKVISSAENSAVVQPIINSNFSMGVQISGNHWAVLSGNSGKSNLVILNYIDSAIIINPRFSQQIGPTYFPDERESIGVLGEMVYSSGGDGLFPSRLPVGVIVEEGPRTGTFKTAYVEPLVNFSELEYVTVIKKLPAKWSEMWPEEKSIPIENPYYGDLNFPDEETETTKPKESLPKKDTSQKSIPSKKEVVRLPQKDKEKNSTKKSVLDLDEEYLLQNLEGTEE